MGAADLLPYRHSQWCSYLCTYSHSHSRAYRYPTAHIHCAHFFPNWNYS
jgi:hypothetical protein